MRSLQVLTLMAVFAGAATASAQAPVRKTAPDTSNPCIGVQGEGLASCGMEAFRSKNYVVAEAAWTKAAEQGDHLAAVWLGQLYGGGDLGERDHFKAYKWYDIAAYLHGLEIDLLPAGAHEDNQLEINWRDSTGKNLTPEQISDAQKQSRDWIAQRKRSSRQHR